MKTSILIILISVLLQDLYGQHIVEGYVSDKKGPLTGANVYLKSTYEGTISDTSGYFKFTTSQLDSDTLIVRFVGYNTYKKAIVPGSKSTLQIELNPDRNNIDPVVITAGLYAAGDDRRNVALDPRDIVLTASSNGDVYGAINNLPGTQAVGEDGRLFVRGGESYEAKTYMDGMLVNKPYSSRMPDVPTRGRFSPFLFSGTHFSTGAYSAEYGQALSSALVLQTNALPEDDITSINLYSLGIGGSHTKRWDESSLSLSVDYFNLGPTMQVFKQNVDWEKHPQTLDGIMTYNKRIGEEGMLKAFASYSSSLSAIWYPVYGSDTLTLVDLDNKNSFAKVTLYQKINDNWILNTGLSNNYDYETIFLDQDKVTTKESLQQVHLNLSREFGKRLRLSFGGDLFNNQFDQSYYEPEQNTTNEVGYDNVLPALFGELEIQVFNGFATKIGGRYEYTSVNGQHHFAPRISFGYRLAQHHNLSLAYGKFYQLPYTDYLKFKHDLKPEEADHFIFNYQYEKKRRLLRIEPFYKLYQGLVKYELLNHPDPTTYNNNGDGYVKGIDFFWRDRGSVPNLDYWIMYSYTDSKRNYKDYRQEATPTFVSTHNASLSVKYFRVKWNTQFGATYRFASGRPYFNPNNPEFHADYTKPYNDLSMNISYLTNLFGHFTVVHLSLNNVLGTENTFGYNYAINPDGEGQYQAFPINQSSKRFGLIAILISIE